MEIRARLRTRVSGAVWAGGLRVLGTLAVVTAVASCGELTRKGTGSSYLIVTELVAASGAEPTRFTGVLASDVITVVNGNETIYSDHGRITFQLALKDPGSSGSPAAPSSNNFITVNRYRVRYIRADGRNTPGVDVPYGFDGALTGTVVNEMSASFELVRHTAKMEAPLAALRNNATIIGSIAEVTFYGHDQTGRDVSATARITVEFGNFADPA